jgi:hypothetical protein
MHFEQSTAPILPLTAAFKSHHLKQETFANISKWKARIEKLSPPHIWKNVVLVGHKCDANERRKINPDQGKKYADENGWLFFETSAKESINVTETFLAAARMGLDLQRVVFCCRKFNPAAVFGARWEVVWATSNKYVLAHGKTKEQASESALASTIALFGSKCNCLNEYQGSHHILVFSPAFDEVHPALCPARCFNRVHVHLSAEFSQTLSFLR